MNKKIEIACTIFGSILIIGCLVLMFIGDGEEQIEPTPAPPVQSMEPKPIKTPEPTQPAQEETEEPDRTLQFDNRVTVQKREDSYVDDIEDAEVKQSYNGDLVDDYDFSNGFVLSKTDNIDILTFGLSDGDMVGASGANIHVQEEDALKTTIQYLRERTLTNSGFGYYIGCSPLGIPVGVECDVDTGFGEWSEYYERSSDIDPAHTDTGQLLCDDIVDTAFGPALYLEMYSGYDGMYRAYAYILCERDRILSISISDSSRDYLWSYLLELTNDGITLVR